jgi:hypothetical protein
VASLASESPPTRPPPRSGRASRPLHNARRKGERCARATAAPRSGLASWIVPPPAPRSLLRALSWRPPKTLFTPTWHAVSQVAASGYALARRAMRRNNVLGGPVNRRLHVPPPARRRLHGSRQWPRAVRADARSRCGAHHLAPRTPARPRCGRVRLRSPALPPPIPRAGRPATVQAPDMLGKAVVFWETVPPTRPGNPRPPTAPTHPWQETHELYTNLMSCTSGSMSCHSPARAARPPGHGSRRRPSLAKRSAVQPERQGRSAYP